MQLEIEWPDDPPAQAHSDTSLAAADRIAGAAATLRQRVYQWLLERGAAGS